MTKFKISAAAVLVGLLPHVTEAATYQFKYPSPGLVAVPEKSPVTVAFTASQLTLPDAKQNSFYTYDLTANLVVTGDPAYRVGDVAWAILSGALPQGLSFTNGLLSGSPAQLGVTSALVQATYKGKTSQTTVSLTVKEPDVGIVLQAGGYRTWADGSLAVSCAAYLNPVAPRVYSGNTGDGVYRIQPAGQAATDVKCDMTNDGGGWTLVVGVSGANRNHVVTSAAAWSSLSGAAPKGKLSDAFINALHLKDKSTIGYRVSSNGVTVYHPASCVFSATAAATGDCASYTKGYTLTPTWITGANSSDGCPPPTYYTGLSSMKHAACNGASVHADNGGIVYGRIGNSNTNGMTTNKLGATTYNLDGEVWVR